MYSLPDDQSVSESAAHLSGQELTKGNVKEQVRISTSDSLTNPGETLLDQPPVVCVTESSRGENL